MEMVSLPTFSGTTAARIRRVPDAPLIDCKKGPPNMNVANLPGRFRLPGHGDGTEPGPWQGSGVSDPTRPALLGPGLLTGTRMLVTDGAGFIGSHIVDLLVECGCDEVVVIDDLVRGRVANLSSAMESGRVRLVVADIRDTALVAELLAGIDTVFHQAALRVTHCAAEPRDAMEAMATATHDLLEHCVRAGVSKVVMASSVSVHGMTDAFSTAEAPGPFDNRTLHDAANSFGEDLLRSFNEMYGLPYVALRYFDVYGPRMDIHSKDTEVLIRWMERLGAGLPPIISGDGRQTMDMVHVEDVARANVLAAVSLASNLVLNVGSGEATSVLGLAQVLARVMGRRNLQPEFQPGQSVNPASRRVAEVSAAQDRIGFEASLPLTTGLEDLVTWWCAEADAVASHEAAL
jgi:UDP-glucose 4-epimerase